MIGRMDIPGVVSDSTVIIGCITIYTTQTSISITIKISVWFNVPSKPNWHSITFIGFPQTQQNFIGN